MESSTRPLMEFREVLTSPVTTAEACSLTTIVTRSFTCTARMSNQSDRRDARSPRASPPKAGCRWESPWLERFLNILIQCDWARPASFCFYRLRTDVPLRATEIRCHEKRIEPTPCLHIHSAPAEGGIYKNTVPSPPLSPEKRGLSADCGSRSYLPYVRPIPRGHSARARLTQPNLNINQVAPRHLDGRIRFSSESRNRPE